MDFKIIVEALSNHFFECQNQFSRALLTLCSNANSILLYELHKSIVEREGLVDDERSEECSKGTSSTTCLVQRAQHAIFSTSASLI
jgi:hypothetical protein